MRPPFFVRGDPARLTWHSAHAAVAPWEAQNALDAAFVAYAGVSALRQQIKPDHRVNGIVVGRDWAPNGLSRSDLPTVPTVHSLTQAQ